MNLDEIGLGINEYRAAIGNETVIVIGCANRVDAAKQAAKYFDDMTENSHDEHRFEMIDWKGRKMRCVVESYFLRTFEVKEIKPCDTKTVIGLAKGLKNEPKPD